MSIFDLFDLELEDISSFLKRWHIDVAPEYIQGACDIVIWILLAIALKNLLLWVWMNGRIRYVDCFRIDAICSSLNVYGCP